VLILQVTAKLVALCIPALQNADSLRPGDLIQSPAGAALNVWLTQAVQVMRVSPGSRAAAAVRQQLQESALMQHMGTGLNAAAGVLEIRAGPQLVAACCSASADAVTPENIGTTDAATSMMQMSQALLESDRSCGCLLRTFQLASCVLSPTGDFSIEAALPAAPAAVRLMHKVFQAYSKMQELTKQSSLQHGLWQLAYSNISECTRALETSTKVMWVLAAALRGDVQGTLWSCPAASQLLLSADTVSCLAITLVVK
jgi:hypothetical protein